MVVGGLRGAIAFAMVAEYSGPYNRRYYDCVVLVIVFTTLVQVALLPPLSQGIVAKPLVSALHLQKDRERNPRIRDVQRFEAFQRSLGESSQPAVRRPEAPRSHPSPLSSPGPPTAAGGSGWSSTSSPPWSPRKATCSPPS